MRLRPSGNQGPVATSLHAFQDYQENEAWVWEHLALTRARVITGTEALARDIEAFRTRLVTQTRDAAGVMRDVEDMRTRLLQAKTPQGPLDPRRGAGRLQDVELTAQAACLLVGCVTRDVPDALSAAQEADWLSQTEADTLAHAYTLCWTTLQCARLLEDKPLDPSQLGEGGAAFLLRETGFDSITELQTGLDKAAQAAADVITGLVARTSKGPNHAS